MPAQAAQASSMTQHAAWRPIEYALTPIFPQAVVAALPCEDKA
jgi:hypothetical protein